jgi:hypothetical protein
VYNTELWYTPVNRRAAPPCKCDCLVAFAHLRFRNATAAPRHFEFKIEEVVAFAHLRICFRIFFPFERKEIEIDLGHTHRKEMRDEMRICANATLAVKLTSLPLVSGLVSVAFPSRSHLRQLRRAI